MSAPPEQDIDYMCVFGPAPHIYRGPDKDTVLEGVEPRNAPRSYNGHPVSHGACPRHARHFASSARGYVQQRRRQRELAGQEGTLPDES